MPPSIRRPYSPPTLAQRTSQPCPTLRESPLTPKSTQPTVGFKSREAWSPIKRPGIGGGWPPREYLGAQPSSAGPSVPAHRLLRCCWPLTWSFSKRKSSARTLPPCFTDFCNRETGRTRAGHRKRALDQDEESGEVVSGGYDKTWRLWDLKRYHSSGPFEAPASKPDPPHFDANNERGRPPPRGTRSRRGVEPSVGR